MIHHSRDHRSLNKLTGVAAGSVELKNVLAHNRRSQNPSNRRSILTLAPHHRIHHLACSRMYFRRLERVAAPAVRVASHLEVVVAWQDCGHRNRYSRTPASIRCTESQVLHCHIRDGMRDSVHIGQKAAAFGSIPDGVLITVTIIAVVARILTIYGNSRSTVGAV